MTDFEKNFNELDEMFETRYAEASAYIDAGKKAFENVECHKANKIFDDALNASLPNNNDLLFQQHVSENNMQQFIQPTAADLGAAMHQQMFMGI